MIEYIKLQDNKANKVFSVRLDNGDMFDIILAPHRMFVSFGSSWNMLFMDDNKEDLLELFKNKPHPDYIKSKLMYSHSQDRVQSSTKYDELVLVLIKVCTDIMENVNEYQ